MDTDEIKSEFTKNTSAIKICGRAGILTHHGQLTSGRE